MKPHGRLDTACLKERERERYIYIYTNYKRFTCTHSKPFNSRKSPPKHEVPKVAVGPGSQPQGL